MPTPDNKRERGVAAKPMPGQTVAPTGTSGVVNANYAANAATSNIQAPSQIKIGQQARILDDGSKLATVLQGAAQGTQAGIESYQKMYEYTSNKNLADWETRMAEHYRLVDGDSKKMAEWARASGFAPNDVTAKRYHQLMAAMEDKEEAQYEQDRIDGFAVSLSTKRPTEALAFINDEISKADPGSPSFRWLQQQQNDANQRTVQNTIEAERTMDAQRKQASIDDLGERLNNNSDFAPESLGSPYANFVAQSYALWGEGDKISISDQGIITYNANNGERYETTFDAIPKAMANDMQKDIGDYVGRIDASTDASQFNQATNALGVSFNPKYTTSRRTSLAQTGADGDIAAGIASTGASGEASARLVSENNITLAIDKEGNPIPARNRSNWSSYWNRTTDAIIADENISPEERVRRLRTLQSNLNNSFGDGEENNQEARRRYGMTSFSEYSSETAPIFKKIKETIIRESYKSAGTASAETTKNRAKARTANEMVGVSMDGVEAVQNTMRVAGVGGDTTLTLYKTNERGELFDTISFRDRKSALLYLGENPSVIGSGFSIRVNMQGMTDAQGRGVALSPDGHVWAGSENQPPPTEAIERAKQDRIQYDNAVASDKASVHAALGGLGSLDPQTIDKALTHRLGLIDPADPSSADLALDLLEMSSTFPSQNIGNGIRTALLENDGFKQMMRPTLTPAQISGMEPDESGKLNLLIRLSQDPGNREFVNQLLTGTSQPAPNSAESQMIWRFNQGRHFQGLHQGIAKADEKEVPPLDEFALNRLEMMQSFRSDSEEAYNTTYETFEGLLQAQAEWAATASLTVSPADALMTNESAVIISELWNKQANETEEAVPQFIDALMSDDDNIRNSALLFAQRSFEAAYSDVAFLEMSGSSEAVFDQIDSLYEQQIDARNQGGDQAFGAETRSKNSREIFEKEALSRTKIDLPYDGSGSIDQMDLNTVPFEEGSEYMPIRMQAVQTLILGSVETKTRSVDGTTMQTSDLQTAARVSLDRSDFEFADEFNPGDSERAPSRAIALEALEAFATSGRKAMYEVSDKHYANNDRGRNQMDELIASIADAADITRSVQLESGTIAGSIGITANWKEGPLNETPSFLRRTGTPPNPESRHDPSFGDMNRMSSSYPEGYVKNVTLPLKTTIGIARTQANIALSPLREATRSKSPHATLSGKPIGPIGNQPGGIDTSIREFVNENIQAPLRNFFDSLFGNGG